MVSATMLRRRRARRPFGAVMSWLAWITGWSFVGRGWGPEETGPTLGWDRWSAGQLAGGRMTLSMTWMTPLEAITSGVTTFALSFR